MATHVSFTINSIVLAGIFLIVFGVATSEFSSCASFNNFYYYNYTSPRDCKIGRGLGAFFMVLLFVELIAAFLSSILCCAAICCKRQLPGQVIVVPAVGGTMVQAQNTVVGQTGQLMYIQQGQAPIITSGAIVPGTTTMHVMQQGPQYYPQPAQVAPPPQAQVWPSQNAPPPYTAPMAAGYTPAAGVGPVPQK